MDNVIENFLNSKHLKFHHRASRRGYISRKGEGYIEEYEGRFGKGYIWVRPRFDTTQYVTVEYYLEQK